MDDLKLSSKNESDGDKTIRDLDQGGTYKFLGINEVDYRK